MTTRTLLCYGDSNTHGTEPVRTLGPLSRYPLETRWTGVAAATLGSEWRVIEEGLPARTTLHDDPIEGVHLNGLRYLRPCLLSQLPLDVMTLMLGTNDLKARFSVTPDDIALSIQRLLREIEATSAQFGVAAPKVLLIAPAPIREIGPLAGIFTGGERKSRQLASRYRKMAREAGVGFIDAGTLIQVSEVDGVHIEPDQQRLLGEAIAAEVPRLID
ncbi:SGNH/GDSL hydrolase family protein [Salinicola sp. CR57]|uniref:SGNH/GDSL hydrolase family protein n=1 Tax=Salinicola sp. CR57 TaxID=1949086 RepID=UPI000DA10BAE|nr:SGNH/GDSL hydrolase family protein [Salinicola sp. CR57]